VAGPAPLRLGYAGCGFMAQRVHLPNIDGLDEVELVALAEPRAELRAAVGARYGVARAYPTHHDLAGDPEVEAVMVSGHFSGQGEIAADLLRAGKHVLVEKPLATSVEQADRILEAEAAGGARLMVAYMKRYDPGFRLVRELLASGELGEVRLVRFHVFDAGDFEGGLDTPLTTSDEPLPDAPIARPAGVAPERLDAYVAYLVNYVHDLNMVRWLLDAGDDAHVEVVDLDADGNAGVVILRVAGHRTVVETGRTDSAACDEELTVYCERGSVRTSTGPPLLRNQPVRVELSRTGRHGGEVVQLTPREWRWSFREEIRHFAEAVRSGAPFDSSGLDSRTDVRVIAEIFERWAGP
jgi:predicted dehydrogenase